MESIKCNRRAPLFRRGVGVRLVGLVCFLLTVFSFRPCQGQAYEIQQLLLDVEKLTQFKAILSDMRQGYTILTQGYGQVKDLAQGNFTLHQVFLDGLLQVNPEIKKYARVADVIADEAGILSEYKQAYRQFNNSGSFNASELDYISRVYADLTKAALNNINELADVITASGLRMSDDERLTAIDRIYADTNDKLQFFRSFNRRTAMLQIQRKKETNDVNTLQNLYKP